MPSKLQTYMQMADEAQRQLTGSYRGWTGFLTTAARLYKYPYAEQVMIHAQRPDATACAEYDFWNEKMGRYVRRGSKGIALIDSSGERPRLRYVFDVSDTGGREFPKSRYLWEYREEHADAVSAMLESRYGVDGKGGLICLAARAVFEFCYVSHPFLILPVRRKLPVQNIFRGVFRRGLLLIPPLFLPAYRPQSKHAHKTVDPFQVAL